MKVLGNNVLGCFISGGFAKLILRQKYKGEFELGQLLVAGKNKDDYSIYQIKDLYYGSQIPESALELMAGYQLEREESDLKIYESELRNYILAKAKPLINIRNKQLLLPKKLPQFFGDIYEINDSHLDFFEIPKNPLTLGKIRSGSKVLDTEVKVNAKKVLKHHVLIPATTGRGKSNLVKVILYNLMEEDKCGKLVFDPHNEYYGTLNKKGLKDHPKSRDFLKYYTVRDVSGKLDLKFNVSLLYPDHVINSIDLSRPQIDALILYHREYRENWIQSIFNESITPPQGIQSSTLSVLRRRLMVLLNFELVENVTIQGNGIYSLTGYESTVDDIKKFLVEGKTVIIDTSLFTGLEEIFVATIIVESVFYHYKNLKFKDKLKGKPVITIILEEAPRVIGKRILEVRENIFGKIAREGRKFKIGLIALTQLPSLIPREILANMNTKIILGNEMGPERTILTQSSAQDLSDDSQTIASLDIGEAIVTSNFTKFAIPIKIPKFEDLFEEKEKEHSSRPVKKGFPGIK